MSAAREILDFWFGDQGQQRPEWFRKDEAFDTSIRQRFGSLVERALAGERLDANDDAAHSALARVLLLDQFTRNIYRGTPRAFAGDALALTTARAMVARGEDVELSTLQRVFVYLPFEHAEDLAMQHESLRLFEQLGDAGFLDYARRHAVVVERFGRFPHRNAILGRISTPEEIEYLKQPGSGF
jgi:uncharacterized protein (DUF924 family)